MATQITNYQCPACTGPLRFDGASGKLACDYCGSSYPVSDIEKLYAARAKAAEQAAAQASPAEAGTPWAEAEAAGLRVYSCPSCGAELMYDATTAATSCPYCGNPTVIPGQLGGTLRPDLVLPFRLDKKAAQEALKRYYKGKKLLPKAFQDDNHIQEIKGVYVPFWLFDGKADGEMSFVGSRSTTFRQGNYRVTRTDHFRVERAGSVQFYKVPVDGSTKMPDAHMDAIEPFDYGELKPFSMAYLPGFMAEKYDVDEKASRQRAHTRMMNSFEGLLRGSVQGYSMVRNQGKRTQASLDKPSYALLPVWMLHTRWNGKDFLFAMNGQTGRLVGDLPIDKKKELAWFAGISLPLMAVLGILLFLL